MNLKCDFNGFQTMIIKLISKTIEDEEKFRCILIMNSDSTATLNFFQVLEYKKLSLLEMNMKLGDETEINKHVSYKYKLVSYQLAKSKEKLLEVAEILKNHNPSLVQQINQAAMLSQPYHQRNYDTFENYANGQTS